MSLIPDRVDKPTGRVKLHARQAAFVLSKCPVTVGLAGIRSGKTHGGAFKTITYALQHPCKPDEVHLIGSPTYPMSRVPMLKVFTLLHDKSVFPVNPLIRFIKSERIFVLRAVGGAITRIQVASLSDPDKIRGIKALSAWLDEAAFLDEYAWTVVQGRVADTAGPIWLTTTPDGYNFVHDLYETACQEQRDGVPLDKRSVRFIHWTSYDNPFMADEGRQRLAASYDSRTQAQELEAKFVKQSGLVYYPFTKATHVRPHRIDAGPILVGQDFNVMKMATVFAQPAMINGKPGLHVFDERIADNTDTFQLADYLVEWCRTNGIDKKRLIIYADASGAARSTSGKSDHRILKEAGFRVERVRSNPRIKDRVNSVNALLAAHNGPSRFRITGECANTIESFEKQTWDTDVKPAIPDKKNGLDHIMDALGYMVWQRFPLRAHASLGGVNGRPDAKLREYVKKYATVR